ERNKEMVLSRFPRLSKNLPLLSFVVASSALSFQILVLYPWHMEIDRSHHQLANKIEELTNDPKRALSRPNYDQVLIGGNTAASTLPAASSPTNNTLQNLAAKLGGGTN
ncbi:hypothetical protein SAMD00019534_060260, partial [Acytostelium subglobosum LB1]|uniref:hypothetical protein n=1 Tax=Acytostelium subglobosum LB1 TaxID=1410327 RepID=UPI0006449DFE